MNPIISNGNKLRWKFQNFKDIKESGMYSDNFEIDGIDWKLKICAETKDAKKWLSLYLKFRSDNKKEKNWICEVDAKYLLLNQRVNRKNVVKEAKNCFRRDVDGWGYCEFIDWDEMISIENGYLKDDSIVVEIDFDFKYYDFSKKISNFTDIVVKVEDTDFHVNKWVLCSKSDFFYDLFVNKKSKKTIIKLEDIKATDFGILLASFNPLFDSVHRTTYVELMKVAQQFGAPSLHHACEQFLIEYSGLELIDKVKIAEENDYESLMKSCIESLKTGADITLIHAHFEYPKLKESTKLRIMQRFMDF